MIKNDRLDSSKVCLMVIDVQDKLFVQVERQEEVIQSIQKVVKGFQIMKLPIVVSEQYPEGLGNTVASLKTVLGNCASYFTKFSFSCFADEKIAKFLLPYDQFILVGMEAHICILQTAKDLNLAGKQVIVLSDAITSRSMDHLSIAIAELRDMGVRISSVETILFELLKDSKSKYFKQISQLVKYGV